MSNSGLFDSNEEKIFELMRKGYSFDQIAVEVMPEDESNVMRHVALFRRIDAGAFECVLPAPDPNVARQLESLRASDYLAVTTGGIFAIRDKLRDTFIKRWDVQMDSDAGRCIGKDAYSFLNLQQKLANHFRERGRDFELEHLHHLIPANPDAGIRRMEEMLRERLPQPDETTQGATDATLESARDGIALASAFDVLDVVDKQLEYVPENLKESYKSVRRQVEASSYWCDAWYRTRRYIPRQRIHTWFKKLHAPNGSRILEIHAPGGSGKTMSLRWLITHHCIPRREPIAHLDFDHFIGSPQEPWQLLLRCAEQLDRQLAGAPFTTLILDGQAWESTLQSNPSSTQLYVDPIKIKNFSEDFPRRFGNLLTSASKSIVTIIVDTFEEAMVHGLTPVAPFIAWLVRFAQHCLHVRLIICGRYSLEHRNFGATLKDEYSAEYAFYEKYLSRQRFPQFDEAESDIFFAKRGVSLDEELRTKLFESIGTLVDNPPKLPGREVSPFDLSLVADLLKDREGDPRQLFQDIDTIKVIYLIERVITRIKDGGVRWLLRYGVVPRRLSKEFFKEVIVPHLKKIHAGRSAEDNPIDDPLPLDLHEKSLYFTGSPLLKQEPDLIWDSLFQYAGPDSWVEAQGNDTMCFNPRAREPMRALLRQHMVLRSIHYDAGAYFEEKARLALVSGDRIACLREAVYHRFQWEGQNAGRFWKKLLDDCLAQEDFETCFSIAKEITGEEYNPTDSQPLVDRETLLDACFNQGLSALDLADLADDDRHIRKQRLHDAGQAQEAMRSKEGLMDSWRILGLMITVRQTYDRDELLEAFKNIKTLANGANLTPELKARTDRSLAIGQDRLSDGLCVPTYARLLRERLDNPSLVQNPMTVFLAQSLARSTVVYGGSTSDFKLLSIVAAVSFPPELQAKLIQLLARTLASFMRAESARELIGERTPDDATELDLLRIEGIARTDPQTALKQLLEFRARYIGPEHDIARASSLRVEAWTCSMLYDIYAASAALADARGLFMKAGETSRAASCHASEAAFWLHLHGNFARASRALDQRKRSVYGITDRDDPDALPEKLLELELVMRSENPPTAPYDFSSLIDEAEQSTRLYDRVNCAMTLFSVLEPPALEKHCNRLARLLIDAFEQMPDSLARANYPWLLRNLRHRIKLDRGLEQSLVDLVSIPDAPELLFGREAGASDGAWAALAQGYLLRFIGRVDKAGKMADLAEHHFSRIGSLSGLREVWHLNAECERRVPTADDFQAYRGQASYLDFVVSVEQAEHSIERNDIDSAEQWMHEVDLKRLYELPTHFAPRAMVVLAKLAQARANGKSVEALLLRAEKAYESLADHRNAAQCRADLDRLRKGTITNIDSVGSKWKSQISTGTGNIPVHDDIETAWPLFPRQVLSLSETPAWIDALAEFGSAVSPPSLRKKILRQHETAPFELIEAAAKHPNLLAGPVFEHLAATELSPGSPCDLAISADALTGAGIPWELARLNHDTWSAHHFRLLYRTVRNSDYRIQWLQRALRVAADSSLAVDGLWGPQTAAALYSFRQQTGIEDERKLKRELGSAFRQRRKAQEPPMAIILQSTTEQQRSGQRGIQFVGSMLPRLYEKLGFRCQIFFGLDLPGFFSEWQHGDLPALIHIYAPYVDSPSLGGVLPDFGDVYTQHSKLRAGNARERPNEFRVPLIILDGPAELEPSEHMLQIFLRNAAATLLALDPSFPNILGLGLDHQTDLRAMEKLLAAILEGKSFRDIYFNLVKDGPVQEAEGLNMDNLFQATGKLAPALWSADPDLSILL